MDMTQRLPTLLAASALLAQPTVASAQDTAQDRQSEEEALEFECPEDLGGLPDLIQRRCREAVVGGRISPVQGLNSPTGFRGVRVMIPVAAMAAAGIALTALKKDRPVSR